MSQPQLAAAATAANSHVQFSDLSWSQISGFSYFFMCSYSSRHSGAAAPCETKPARLSRAYFVGEADAFGSSLQNIAEDCISSRTASSLYFFHQGKQFSRWKASSPLSFQDFSSMDCHL